MRKFFNSCWAKAERMRLFTLIGWIGTVGICSASTPTLDWTRQFGSSRDDFAWDVVVDDADNAYITGYTKGALFGPRPVQENAFIAKYDAAGNRVWQHQFGAGNEMGRGIAKDELGNIYVGGQTHGDFAQPSAGHYDNFVVKYDADGGELWRRQWGSNTWDAIYSVAADGGSNLFVTGQTLGALEQNNAGKYDAFISKLDDVGDVVWTKQLGTGGDDVARRVTVDAMGNAYAVGFTEGNLFGGLQGIRDAYLTKYDSLGNAVWSRQFGTAMNEQADGVVVDESGNVYVAGSTNGTLTGYNRGHYDAFLRKYDPSGNEVWTRQIGSSGLDMGLGVTIGNHGQIYMVGAANGGIGDSYAGNSDIFVSAFTVDGVPLWNYQLGSAGADAAYNIASSDLGKIYVVGATGSHLGDVNNGLADAVLVKLDVPGAGADYNNDGNVDAADYVLWRKNGNAAGYYAAWRTNFGQTVAGGSQTSHALPEPAAVFLLVSCMAVNLIRRRPL
jgi:Beta-propeller repeat